MLCPALVSPNLTQSAVAGSEDGNEVEVTELDESHDEDVLREIGNALESGLNADGGSSIQDAELCGPTDGSGPRAQKPTMIKGPINPTQADMDLHNLTHLPCMSWCPHCVACRLPNVAHVTSTQECNIPQLATRSRVCWLYSKRPS